MINGQEELEIKAESEYNLNSAQYAISVLETADKMNQVPLNMENQKQN